MKKQYIIPVVLAIAIFAGGYFLGKRKTIISDPIETKKIDSLEKVIKILNDSTVYYRDLGKEVSKVVTLYKTVYDTVKLYKEPSEVIERLNTISNTPPQ